MNKYKVLIDVLKIRSEYSRDGSFWNEAVANDIDRAINAIEQLAKDNDVLTKERDAAISEIPRACPKCEHNQDGHFRTLADGKIDDLCRTCFMNGRCNFKWRGVQE